MGHYLGLYPLAILWNKASSPAFFEILASKCIGVTTLTFQGNVMSSITCPFQVPISYRRSIVTKWLSPAVSQILGPKHIGVTNFDHLIPRYPFPIMRSIVTKSLSLAIFEIFGSKCVVLSIGAKINDFG